MNKLQCIYIYRIILCHYCTTCKRHLSVQSFFPCPPPLFSLSAQIRLFCGHEIHVRVHQTCVRLKHHNYHCQNNQRYKVHFMIRLPLLLLRYLWFQLFFPPPPFPLRVEVKLLFYGHGCHIHVPQTPGRLTHHNHY